MMLYEILESAMLLVLIATCIATTVLIVCGCIFVINDIKEILKESNNG